MIFLIILFFVLCHLGGNYRCFCFTFKMCVASETLKKVIHICFIINSAVNPLVYAVLKKDVKQELKKVAMAKKQSLVKAFKQNSPDRSLNWTSSAFTYFSLWQAWLQRMADARTLISFPVKHFTRQNHQGTFEISSRTDWLTTYLEKLAESQRFWYSIYETAFRTKTCQFIKSLCFVISKGKLNNRYVFGKNSLTCVNNIFTPSPLNKDYTSEKSNSQIHQCLMPELIPTLIVKN